MKNLFFLAVISLALTFSACSNMEQDIISPIDTQLEKGNARVQVFPYDLYQTFDEFNNNQVTWRNYKTGVLISVKDPASLTPKHVYATIEYIDSKGIAMVFLGYVPSGQYFLSGVNEKEISSLRIFTLDVNSIGGLDIFPYKLSQVFFNHGVEGWSDGTLEVKIHSKPFPKNMEHLFGFLSAKEGNQLVFLGKPESESFGFPKSKPVNLKDIKLFTYQK